MRRGIINPERRTEPEPKTVLKCSCGHPLVELEPNEEISRDSSAIQREFCCDHCKTVIRLGIK